MSYRIGGFSRQQYSGLLHQNLPKPLHFFGHLNFFPLLAVLVNRFVYLLIHQWKTYPNNEYLLHKFQQHNFLKIDSMDEFQIARAVLRSFQQCNDLIEVEQHQKTLDAIYDDLYEVGKRLWPKDVVPAELPEPLALEEDSENEWDEEDVGEHSPDDVHPVKRAIKDQAAGDSVKGKLTPSLAPPQGLKGSFPPPPPPPPSGQMGSFPPVPPGSIPPPPPGGFPPPPPPGQMGVKKLPLTQAKPVVLFKDELQQPSSKITDRKILSAMNKEQLEEVIPNVTEFVAALEKALQPIQKLVKEEEALNKKLTDSKEELDECTTHLTKNENIKETLSDDMEQAMMGLKSSKQEEAPSDFPAFSDEKFQAIQKALTDRGFGGSLNANFCKSTLLKAAEEKIEELTKQQVLVKATIGDLESKIKEIQAESNNGVSFDTCKQVLMGKENILKAWKDALKSAQSKLALLSKASQPKKEDKKISNLADFLEVNPDLIEAIPELDVILSLTVHPSTQFQVKFKPDQILDLLDLRAAVVPAPDLSPSEITEKI